MLGPPADRLSGGAAEDSISYERTETRSVSLARDADGINLPDPSCVFHFKEKLSWR